MSKRIVVIGGGPAGMMAAVTAAEALTEAGFALAVGAPGCASGDGGSDKDKSRVVLIEQNDRLGKKLRITGKGRCNVTNDCGRDEFLSNVPTNPRFLYAALSGFDTQDTKVFFEAHGVPLKVERGKRVFPVSDKAGDIAEAMIRACRQAGVTFMTGRVSAILTVNGEVSGVRIGNRTIEADAVILCTGGRSYPVTGSDGNGYALAEKLGHTIQPPIPSLVPIVCEGDICSRLMGLSLRNVRLRVLDVQKNKCVFEDFGEMLFAHYGVTGPLILSASAHIHDLCPGKYKLSIDLKPALDEQTLDARIQSDFRKYVNKDFINALSDLLPQKAIEPVAALSGIDFRKKVNTITREERHALVTVLKNLELSPIRFRPIDEAIVTKGGVTVKEVDPKTMESRLCSGLYFAGEILDVDAYTGGFNLQIAFSTGRLAGLSSAE
ncbi:MAG: NAD(P)/FAD-dependent oxidoreductase [Clostridia bacterium]|nr:NAD(P)/FAD-dependent oxidoreductase [Clostridia bacterium]